LIYYIHTSQAKKGTLIVKSNALGDASGRREPLVKSLEVLI